MPNATILLGDARTRLADIPDQSVQCVITSPPYWGLRDYGKSDQIGLEPTPTEYVREMVAVFDEVWRVLKDDGVLWLNLGDSYAGNTSRASTNGRAGYGTDREGVFTKTGDGIKPKDLVGIPWRVAFALQDAGWYLRQDIIWHKPNPIPESVTDRCTKSHEYLFLLSKSPRYYFDNKAIAEEATSSNSGHRFGGSKYGDLEDDFFRTKGATYTATGTRNKRDVWTIPTKSFKGAHFAVMPEALVEPCVLASTTQGDTILDPFTGSGTVAVVALNHNRNFIGTELNEEYAAIAQQRIGSVNPMFNTVTIKQV
jgi:site-specific DNA-methyltransferase (adenine-specific)